VPDTPGAHFCGSLLATVDSSFSVAHDDMRSIYGWKAAFLNIS
jgi:hypothetical protein